VKGYRSKLEKLAKDFHAFRGCGGLTRTILVKIAHGACYAVHTNNVLQLQRDFREHYLGYHESCNSEWCSEAVSGHPKIVNLDDLPPNLLFKVEWAGDRLVNKAH